MSDGAQTRETQEAPSGTALRQQYGPPPVPLIAWSGGRPMLTFVTPFVVGLLLAGAVISFGLRSGHVVLANGAFVEVAPPATSAVTTAVAVGSAVAGFAFGLTAMTAVMIASANETATRPMQAWRWTFRRRRLVVEAVLAVALTVVVATVLVRSWHDGGKTIVAAMVVLLVVAAVVAAPLLLGWVLVVAGVPRREALRRGWASGRAIVRGGVEATSTPRRALVAATSAMLSLGFGIVLLTRFLPASVLRSSLTMMWCCIAVTFLVMTIVAIAVRGAAVRDKDGRLRAPVVASLEDARRPPRDGLAASGVLLVPAVVFAVLVSSNPFGMVQYTVATVDARLLGDSDAAEVGDRTAVVSTPGDPPSGMRLCRDASCGWSADVIQSSLGSAIGPAGDGGLLTAQWAIKFDRHIPKQYELEVVHSRPDQLEPAPQRQDREWATGRSGRTQAQDDDTASTGQRTVLAAVDVGDPGLAGARMTEVAVVGQGDQPVVAGIARGAEPEAQSHLFVVFCGEPSCVHPTVRKEALPWIPPYWDQQLGLAVAPNGTAVISLVSETDSRLPQVPALRVVSVHPDGAETIVQDLPDALPSQRSVRPWEAAPDARVAIGADGNPVLLGRSGDSDAQRLTFCSDVSCSSSTHRDISPAGSPDAPPAFVIDRTGRPLIAVRDDERGAVGVISCSDVICGSYDETTIARFPSVHGEVSRSSNALAIELAADGTPILVASAQSLGDGSEGLVIRCTRARCGAS